jgi:catechol 2,3-dioxygenase-like lactoylglutathione lyase family enzyme
MKTLRLFSLLVRDYEEAIRFYTDKLGFTVSEDAAVGEDRWVVLDLPESREPGLALTLAQTEEDRAVVGHQAGSFPLFALGTDDCLEEYRRMQERGVVFHGEPQREPWGTGVLFEDLYGNKIYLNQEP